MHFFTRIPLPQEGCPLQILVWGHGRRCCSHPPPPGPREAARGPKRGRTRLPSSAVYCLGSRGRGPSPQAKPNGTKGEKILRKLWCLKSPNFRNCGFEIRDVLSPSNCFKTMVAFVCYWSHVSHVGSQKDLDKLKHTPWINMINRLRVERYNFFVFCSWYLGRTWPN